MHLQKNPSLNLSGVTISKYPSVPSCTLLSPSTLIRNEEVSSSSLDTSFNNHQHLREFPLASVPRRIGNKSGTHRSGMEVPFRSCVSCDCRLVHGRSLQEALLTRRRDSRPDSIASDAAMKGLWQRGLRESCSPSVCSPAPSSNGDSADPKLFSTRQDHGDQTL